MKSYALLIAALLWPTYALSDSWVPITSEIPGMQLWTFPEDAYEGDDNEFMRHCNDGKLIYVSTLEAPVKCHFKTHQNSYGFYQITIKANDKGVSDRRLVIISKSPIPPRVKPLTISPEEIEILSKAERKSVAAYDQLVHRQFLELNKGSAEHDYVEYVRSIKSGEKYRKHIGARVKLPTPNGFIFISSVGLDASAYIGWEIVNVVYREVDGQIHEIGTFAGCIQGGFRDLNSDGTPEVLTSTCENGESTSDTYWALAPKIEPVLGH